ncbi:MAG: CYTH domain-containing protein [Caulobacterales bacterium]
MALEIERKFLVSSDAWRVSAVSSVNIRQGYLSRAGEVSMRVRIAGTAAFLTLKTRDAGAVRQEFEYAIPPDEAERLLTLCEPPLIEKVRYRVPFGGRVWEVDEFKGSRAGLVLAECELQDAGDMLSIPEWVGAEVTSDPAYRNEAL